MNQVKIMATIITMISQVLIKTTILIITTVKKRKVAIAAVSHYFHDRIAAFRLERLL
ncbi:hypothetical protein [Neobacillus cucumis]|uniref:hypothetical protein n=1 Tax=Neobacillus cucumis TaxID=1740721 RepID=UPI0028530AEF|nr:hypothetical protein [Neobacillus cucumis]MDR4947747.1 hypothetical protein [Neobacillus cucumis]